jgi:hypothetical protein
VLYMQIRGGRTDTAWPPPVCLAPFMVAYATIVMAGKRDHGNTCGKKVGALQWEALFQKPAPAPRIPLANHGLALMLCFRYHNDAYPELCSYAKQQAGGGQTTLKGKPTLPF